MNRAASALVILAMAASACSAQVPAPSPAAPAAPPTAAPAGAECQAASLVLDGIHACMPGEPQQVSWTAEDRWVRGVLSTRGDHEFLAARTAFVGGKGNGEHVLSAMTSSWQQIDESRPFQLGGFEGRAFAGVLDPQHRIAVQAVVVGRQVYFAQVVAAKNSVDREGIQAFFDSMRVDVPWRIHASLAKRYTVAVPEPAPWLTDTRKVEDWTFESEVFPLGGENTRVYMVSTSAIPPSTTETMDEILDSYAENLGAAPGTTILRKIPLSVDGVPGREIICRQANGFIARMRVFGTQKRLAAALIVSKRAETLEDADAVRFFDSFQLTAP
jgi:hypothetical protein